MPKKQEANAINRHYYFVQLFYKKRSLKIFKIENFNRQIINKSTLI